MIMNNKAQDKLLKMYLQLRLHSSSIIANWLITKYEYISKFTVCLQCAKTDAQDTIRVAIEGVTMLRTWCLKKTKLHLLSAYAGGAWRSVNNNTCSRESICSERR